MRFTLEEFVTESNRIEGINNIRSGEIRAHEDFLTQPWHITSVIALVGVLQPGATLRSKPGMNVQVGNHFPLEGGPRMTLRLTTLLEAAENSDYSPWKIHNMYETLHPFMDGNGRSGRAIWLKQMGGIEKAPLGFLHHFYYQTLQEVRGVR